MRKSSGNKTKIKKIVTSKQAYEDYENLNEKLIKELLMQDQQDKEKLLKSKQKLKINSEKNIPKLKLRKDTTPLKTVESNTTKSKVNEKFIQDSTQSKDNFNNSTTLKKEQFEQLSSLQEVNLQDTLPSGLNLKQEKKLQNELMAQQINEQKKNLLTKMSNNSNKLQNENQLNELYLQTQNVKNQNEMQKPQTKTQNFFNVENNLTKNQNQEIANQSDKIKESEIIIEDDKRRKSSNFSLIRRDSFIDDNQSEAQSKISRISQMKKKKPSKQDLRKQQLEEQKQTQMKEELERERKQKEAMHKNQISSKIQNIIKVQARIKQYIQRKKYLKMLKKFNKMKLQNQVEQELLKIQDKNIQDYYNQREKLYISDKYDVAFQQTQSTYTNLRKNTFFPNMFENLVKTGNLDILVDENIKQKQKRPFTAENAKEKFKLSNNALFQTYQQPEIFDISNNFSLPKNNVIDIFLKKNKEKIPLIFKKNNFGQNFDDFQNENEVINLQNKETRIQDKIGKLKGTIIESDQNSVTYSDNFENESQNFSQQSLTKKQMQSFPKQNKIIKKSTSKQSLKDSIISEEDYLKEAFIAESYQHSSNIKESIQEELSQSKNIKGSESVKESIKMSDSKISESIKLDEEYPESYSIISEDNNKDKQDLSSHRKSKSSVGIEEELIQQSGSLSQYDDEKFESISEEQQSKEDKLIQSQSQKKSEEFEQSGPILKKSGGASLSFKKKVRFGGESSPGVEDAKGGLKIQQVQQQQQFEEKQDQIQQKQQFQKIQQNENLLPKFEYFVQQIEVKNLNENQKENEFDGKTASSMQKLIEKYKPLKGILEKDDRSLEFTREQMQIRKIEAEIHQLLNNTQTISQKWNKDQYENILDNGKVQLHAEFLYSKFQFEFNRMLQNNTFSKKLTLLSDYSLFKDAFTNQDQNNNNNKMIQQSTNKFRFEEVIKNIEVKQDILQQVLTQVLQNLTTLRSTQNDFSQIKSMNKEFDLKLEVLLKNQEVILKQQFQHQLQARDDEIKKMLQVIIQNQNKQQQITGKIQYVQSETKKSKLQQLLDLNKDNTPQKFNYEFEDSDDEREKQIKRNIISGKQTSSQFQFQDELEDIYNIDQLDKLSLQQQKLIKQKIEADESMSFDVEAEEKSNISWQDTNLIENLNAFDLKKLNNKSTEQIVKFLSNILMDEIQKDLFPLRQSTSQFEQQHISQEYIAQKSTAVWKQIDSNNQLSEYSQDISPRKLFNNQRSLNESAEFQNRINQNNNDMINKAGDDQDKQESNLYKSDNESETKENEFSFGNKKKNFSNSSFNIESELNTENLPKSTQQGIINNQDLEGIEKMLENYAQILLKNKNKNQIISNILQDIKNNERKQIPEFTGNVLEQMKIFNDTEIKNKKDSSLIHTFEQEVIQQLVGQIQQAYKSKLETQAEIIEFVIQRFNSSVSSAKRKLLKQIQKLVPKEFYKDVEIKPYPDFNKFFDYCNYSQPPIDEQGINKYFDYEIQQSIKSYQNQVGFDVLDLIIQDMADEFKDIQIQRKNMFM